MRPKARCLTQQGGPPGWLEENDPARWDFERDGRSMPPALTDHTTCPGLGLIYYWMYVDKTQSWATSRKEGMVWNSNRPMPSLWTYEPTPIFKAGKPRLPQSTYIYRVPQCMSPRRYWDSPTPSLAIVCAPTPEPKGGGRGGILACGWGVGKVPIPTTREKA
jgi:hypothetical protein